MDYGLWIMDYGLWIMDNRCIWESTLRVYMHCFMCLIHAHAYVVCVSSAHARHARALLHECACFGAGLVTLYYYNFVSSIIQEKHSNNQTLPTTEVSNSLLKARCSAILHQSLYLQSGLVWVIHYTPRGSKLISCLFYTNYKKVFSNCSYTYIYYKTS